MLITMLPKVHGQSTNDVAVSEVLVTPSTQPIMTWVHWIAMILLNLGQFLLSLFKSNDIN